MDIRIVCSSGSPIGIIPPDVEGRGVGGAELALVSTAEQWAKRGHQVWVYNNPRVPGTYNGVNYYPVGDWNASLGDVLIIFRTPFGPAQKYKRKKIFWSCDQYTVGDFRTDVFPYVDCVVTISSFHTQYFERTYNLDRGKIKEIPIGVRTWEYTKEIDKVPGRIIFCSVPDRGLQYLRQAWNSITDAFPELSLVITSDYRLWGAPDPRNEQYRQMWRGVRNVEFKGKIPRSEMVEEQLKAEWMLYPCCYDELFCIAAAECQVAGVIPVTSDVGALYETNAYGVQVSGHPSSAHWIDRYVDQVKAVINVQHKIITPDDLKRVARETFGFDYVMACWDEVFNV